MGSVTMIHVYGGNISNHVQKSTRVTITLYHINSYVMVNDIQVCMLFM